MMAPISRMASSFMPRVVTAGVPTRIPLRHKRTLRIEGNRVFVYRHAHLSERASASLPVRPFALHVDQHQVVVRAAGDEPVAAVRELLGKRLCVCHDLPLVGVEFRRERLLERDRLGGDDVHERAALHAGEDGLVDLLRVLLLAEDEPAPGSPQRLVGRRRHKLRVGNGLGWMPAATSPAIWAMSTMSKAPTSSAIDRNASKSMIRG